MTEPNEREIERALQCRLDDGSIAQCLANYRVEVESEIMATLADPTTALVNILRGTINVAEYDKKMRAEILQEAAERVSRLHKIPYENRTTDQTTTVLYCIPLVDAITAIKGDSDE